MESQHRGFFTESPDGIVECDLRGTIIDCNRSFCQLLEVSREKLIGTNWDELGAEESNGEQAKALERLTRGDAAQVYRREYKRKNGSRFPLEATVFPRKDEKGETRAVWGIVRDITHRVKVEKALKESELKFNTIVDCAYDWEYWRGADDRFIYITPSVERITGYKVGEFMDDPDLLLRIVHPEDNAYIEEHFHEVRTHKGGVTPRLLEFRIIKRSGEIRWIGHVCQAVFGENMEYMGRRSSNRDITESKELEEAERLHREQLLQADKMASLGVLVSGVAHEINNPNNLIMLNASFLDRIWREVVEVLDKYAARQTDFKLNELPYQEMRGEFQELLNGISQGAERIERIVRGLKEFSRTDTGETRRRIDLNIVIRDALLITNNIVKKSTEHFYLECEEGLPMVTGRSQQLEQVLINLINNACQALTGREQYVKVRTESDEKRVRVVVEDEGVGIPREFCGKVMDPFFTTKRDGGGTGLGLSVSYGIVNSHGGSLTLRPRDERGSIAIMELSRCDLEDEAYRGE